MPAKKLRVKRKCASCGVVYELYPSQVKRGKGRYCSKVCADAGRKHGSELFCSMCDSVFYRRFGEQGETVKAFCSRQCYSDWRAEKRTSYPKIGSRHQHRVVAEAVLGRALTPAEVVHHVDHDKQNSDPRNLAVFSSQSHHARCHFGKMPAAELRKFLLLNLPKGPKLSEATA